MPSNPTNTVLRAILDSVVEGILVVDVDGAITLFNSRFTDMWGIARDLILQRNDKKLLQFVLDQLIDPNAFMQKIQLLYGSHVREHDFIKFKDGKTFDRFTAPMELENDKLGRIWTFRDITGQVDAEQEIHRYKNHLEELVAVRTKDLEQANTRLEAFSYSASHDLQAPLRSIDGYCAILLEDYQDTLDEQGKKYLSQIRLSVEKMGTLISKLLKLSQVTHNQLSRENIDLTAIVTSILSRLHRDTPERQLEVDIANGMQVYADSALLKIALENLLENAWKYTGTQEKSIIKVGYSIENEETVFYIKDNGIGFDSDAENKLFKPFQRLSSAREFSGTGIGLATVQRIIARHDGRIWAVAEPGKGATFYFTLSLAK
ncbi:MAG: ATP-binding protein [Thiohalomonadales bacterium]